MAPFFTVFTTKNETASLIINRLTKYYAPPLVDGISYYAQNFRDKYRGMNGKYFSIEGDQLLIFDGESIGLIQPHFILSFDHGTKISRNDWKLVLRYLDAILFGQLTDELKIEFETLVPKPVPISPEPKPEPKTVPANYVERDDYEFTYEVDHDHDIAFCQIDKPFTDRPYTVVIRNYSQKGIVPVFTALYIAQSWGVASHDYAFLVKLWDYLELEIEHGPLNLEQRLKADIERCKSNPELEPEVYRETLTQVREKLQKSRERKHLLQ